MKINEKVLLLTYYYHSEDRNHPLLKYVKTYLGAYLPFNLYLYDPLSEIFSQVILYDYLKRRAEIGENGVNEEILAIARKEHLKYVLWTSWQYDVRESTLEELRKESIVVGWFFDDDWRFDEYSRWWISCLDYCVTNAIDAIPKYQELGARIIQTIPNTGVAKDLDWPGLQEKYDVSFVGSKNCADRMQFISTLEKNGIPVSAYGEGSGGYISFDQMLDIFSQSKINLNFSKDVAHHGKLQIKGRVFQVCLAGGFMLTEYAPGIEKYFEIDKEIVCFHNADELLLKIQYYLDHDNERRAIAHAGWKRATRYYSSSRMVEDVFEEIEGDSSQQKNGGRLPQHLIKYDEMPLHVRNARSTYQFQWARALLENNKMDEWKSALHLSLYCKPISPELITGISYYWFISHLPVFIRRPCFVFYNLMDAVIRGTIHLLGSVVSIRRMKYRFLTYIRRSGNG